MVLSKYSPSSFSFPFPLPTLLFSRPSSSSAVSPTARFLSLKKIHSVKDHVKTVYSPTPVIIALSYVIIVVGIELLLLLLNATIHGLAWRRWNGQK